MYVVVKDANGVTQCTRQAWPHLATGSVAQNVNTYNFVRNWTFASWSNTTSYTGIKTKTFPAVLTDFVTDDWAYQQDDATQTINISRGTFNLGEESVDDNPPYYLIYENANHGSAIGTVNRFMQTFDNVQTLSNNEVAISIDLKLFSGFAAGDMTVSLIQYFGTGGSPSISVETPVVTITADDFEIGEFKNFEGTVTLPTVNGKTAGSNGDSKLILCINMPLNITTKIGIGPIRLESGESVTGTQQFSNDDIVRSTNTVIRYPAWSTGDVKFTTKIAADTGWLMMDDTNIGNNSSGANHTGNSLYALFNNLWTNIFNASAVGPYLVPLYN